MVCPFLLRYSQLSLRRTPLGPALSVRRRGLVDMGRIYRYKFQPANRKHSLEDEVALSWAYVEVW